MPTIGVCLIVKNESKVICRCLDSVKPFVSFVCVEDTGSTDGTQSVIRTWLAENGIPGEVYDRPWVNFAHNRSSVLQEMRKHAEIDYVVMIDADDVFVVEDTGRFKKALQELTADAYKIKLAGNGVEYYRVQLFRNALSFYYRGVLHEFPEGPLSHTVSVMHGCYMLSHREGARSDDPEKYKKDATLLKAALSVEQDEFLVSRYTFYLAQSYRDSGQPDLAIECYLKRAELGFWIEERYISLYQAAVLMEQSRNCSDELIKKTYSRAIALLPERVEASHALARFLRSRKRYLEAIQAAMDGWHRAKAVPEGLFVEAWIYEYGLLDELVISNYWAGAYQNSLDFSMQLMAVKTVPLEMRERIWKNARFAKQRLLEKLNRFDEIEQEFLLKSFNK